MKRSIGIGLAAILAVAAIVPAAVSQGRAPAKLDPKQIAKGMAEVPALIPTAGVSCTPKNALYLGGSTDSKTKVKTDGYEVACNEGMGFVIIASTSAPKPQVFSCLETANLGPDGKPQSIACKLPENADQSKALQPFLTKAGSDCVPTKARAIGATTTNISFEAACESGKGVVVSTASPASTAGAVEVNPCLAYEAGTNLACTLTDTAAQLKVVDTLAAKSDKACTIKDRRYVLTTGAGDNYYEVACTDGKGYVLQEAKNGSLTRTIDCAQADFVGGGCKLTDSRAAATEQNGLYTRLAKAAGFNCDVSKYGTLQGAAGVDTVELACSNRPDGAIALFGRDAASTKVYDCVQGEVAGFRCSFTKYDPLYGKLSTSLKGLKPDTTCQASASSARRLTKASSNWPAPTAWPAT